MSEMSEKEENQACDALIGWFISQEITPVDAVPIMIKAIFAALASCVAPGACNRAAKIADLHHGVETATKMLTETVHHIVERDGDDSR